MNKPKLSDYSISNSQYLKYEEYRIKCKTRENKIETIVFVFGTLYALLVVASVIFLLAVFLFRLDRYPLVNTLALVVLVGLVCAIITIKLVSQISEIIEKMCGKIYGQPRREPYFTNIETFEEKSKEYEKYGSPRFCVGKN